jgi:hypothetical protein
MTTTKTLLAHYKLLGETIARLAVLSPNWTSHQMARIEAMRDARKAIVAELDRRNVPIPKHAEHC